MSGAFWALLAAARLGTQKIEKPCVWCGNTGKEAHPQMPGATRPCSVCRAEEIKAALPKGGE